jgi:N-methylhydantoinase B/oxoprolinase/acetone carboxylase alpha subunit
VNAIDPITLEIMWQRLVSIMDEVDSIIVKTTFSTILRESRDFACILTDPLGRSLCQSSLSTANFPAVYPLAARVLLERYPLHTLREGDVIATNDPWIGTGHLPDYILLRPVFWKGKVVACMGTVSHMSDVGGHPGEIEGEDVFSEGLRMLPFKLYDAGEENRIAFDVIGANCRAPDLLLGDLRAMAGATHVGAERLHEFLRDEGADDLSDLAGAITERSETAMRRAITALPDGAYEYGLDIDGYIETAHLHVTVTVEGDGVLVDFEGTSGQSPHGAINSSYNSTLSSVGYPFKCALVPDVPNNEALFRPIRVRIPEGSILNTHFPKAVKARAKTTNNINQVLFGALWPIFGERVQASNGAIWPWVLKGREPDLGPYLIDMLPHGGRGGQPTMDGMLPVAYPNNSTITPCEVLESQSPLLFRRKALRPDSAGAGRHRGGLGQVIVFEHVGKAPAVFSLTPDRITTNPVGLAGGGPGRIGKVVINGRKIFEFPAIELQPGDVVELHIAGGGGFGAATERERALVLHDVKQGYLTPEGAREQYGVEEEGEAGSG